MPQKGADWVFQLALAPSEVLSTGPCELDGFSTNFHPYSISNFHPY